MRRFGSCQPSQGSGRLFITPVDPNRQVSKAHREVAVDASDDQVVHLAHRGKFACGVHCVSDALRVEFTARLDDVPRFENVPKLIGSQIDLGPVGAVDFDVDAFRLHTPKVHAGHRVDEFHLVLDPLCEDFELARRVGTVNSLRAWHGDLIQGKHDLVDVAEIRIDKGWVGSSRQFWLDGPHLGADLVPYLVGIGHPVVCRHLDDGQADERLRRDCLNLRDFSDDLFQRVGDELLHLCRRGPGPTRDDESIADGDFRVLTPRHRGKVGQSDGEQYGQKCKDDRPVGQTESGKVHGFRFSCPTIVTGWPSDT